MEQKDETLWRLAQKRARFKRHLFTYLVVNTFLWCIWYFSHRDYSGESGIPWPVWPMFGWGLGIVFQYFEAYHTDLGWNAEKEYEKLKNQGK